MAASVWTRQLKLLEVLETAHSYTPMQMFSIFQLLCDACFFQRYDFVNFTFRRCTNPHAVFRIYSKFDRERCTFILTDKNAPDVAYVLVFDDDEDSDPQERSLGYAQNYQITAVNWNYEQTQYESHQRCLEFLFEILVLHERMPLANAFEQAISDCQHAAATTGFRYHSSSFLERARRRHTMEQLFPYKDPWIPQDTAFRFGDALVARPGSCLFCNASTLYDLPSLCLRCRFLLDDLQYTDYLPALDGVLIRHQTDCDFDTVKFKNDYHTTTARQCSICRVARWATFNGKFPICGLCTAKKNTLCKSSAQPRSYRAKQPSTEHVHLTPEQLHTAIIFFDWTILRWTNTQTITPESTDAAIGLLLKLPPQDLQIYLDDWSVYSRHPELPMSIFLTALLYMKQIHHQLRNGVTIFRSRKHKEHRAAMIYVRNCRTTTINFQKLFSAFDKTTLHAELAHIIDTVFFAAITPSDHTADLSTLN